MIEVTIQTSDEDFRKLIRHFALDKLGTMNIPACKVLSAKIDGEDMALSQLIDSYHDGSFNEEEG